MADIDKKNSRAMEAAKWLDRLAVEHGEELAACVRDTYTNVPECLPMPTAYKTKTSIFKTDSVKSLFAGKRYNPHDQYCVLNFASYYHPGGGFLKGSKAQEEDLCMQSGLYPVLNAFRDIWYRRHCVERPKLYGNDFIYSRNVPFFNGKQMVRADVLTMAAVNFSQLEGEDVHEGGAVMLERMRVAYEVPHLYGADRVILGAWGCGVFKNNPVAVAERWKSLTEQMPGYYAEIVHAIPDVETFDVFMRVYGVAGKKGVRSK